MGPERVGRGGDPVGEERGDFPKDWLREIGDGLVIT
jgi:hypothetical protein